MFLRKKKFLKIATLSVVGIVAGLPVILYLGLSLVVHFTEPLPPPPSIEVQKMLSNQVLYFGYDSSIYKTTGYQRNAELVREKVVIPIDSNNFNIDEYYFGLSEAYKKRFQSQSADYKLTSYALPAASPDGKYLAYYKIYSISHYSEWNPLTYMVEAAILNLEENEEQIINDSREMGIQEFPWYMMSGDFGLLDNKYIQNIVLAWSDDSKNLNMNFIDDSYTFNLEKNTLTKLDEKVDLPIDKTYTCYFSRLPSQEPCLTSHEGRFEYYQSDRQGLNSKWYILGKDTKTDKEFLVTIFERALYSE